MSDREIPHHEGVYCTVLTRDGVQNPNLMTGTDQDTDETSRTLEDRLSETTEDLGRELLRSRGQSASENARQSVAGWRDIAGSSLGFAVFIDLLTMGAGGYLALSVDASALQLLGVLFVAIGIVGIVEKLIRRVRA